MRQSELSKQPIKILCYISEKLIKNDFSFDNPYDDFSSNESLLGDIANSFLGERFDEILDVEFMARFIKINSALLTKWLDGEIKLNEITNKLLIPKPKEYDVEYEIWGPATLTENYKTNWISYEEDWVSPSIDEAQTGGIWSYYDGDYIDNESDNFEGDNFQIKSIDEKRKSGLREQKKNYSKIILEKSDSFLNQFDKESLLKLKNIIDERLNLL